MLTDSLICDSLDFTDILGSAVGAKNGLKIGQKYSTSELLLLIHRLTVLAENLQGTSQECKKFDGSRILNFEFFCKL